MSDQTVIHFSDGTDETFDIALDLAASQVSSTPEGFMALTTADGRVLHINRAHVVPLGDPGSPSPPRFV